MYELRITALGFCAALIQQQPYSFQHGRRITGFVQLVFIESFVSYIQMTVIIKTANHLNFYRWVFFRDDSGQLVAIYFRHNHI